MPGIWKWVEEIDPKSVFDIKLSEGTSQAVITATLDRLYSDDVTINLSTGGSTSVDEDYTISSTVISIPSGSISGTAVLTLVDDILDEDDSDTIKIEVGSSDFAVESVDQKILIAVEDDDEMPSVSLATSQTAIAENGGTSNLTATLSSVSGRDVKVNLRVSGTASSQDFTLNGDEIDIAEVLTDDLVLNYTFSGDASDGSSNGNDGTVYGATLTEDRFGEEN